MAGPQEIAIDVQHAFGSYCALGLRGSALFGDDSGHHLVYPVGRHVALRHIDSGEASLLSGGSAGSAEGVTSCATSRDRALLVVGERRSAEPFASLAVYDLRLAVGAGPTKVLEPFRGLGQHVRVAGVAFSADGEARFLAAITVGAEAALTVLDWQSNRVLGKLKLDSSVDRVLWSPQHDTCYISVSGPHLLRLAQLKDGMSKIRESSLKAMGPITNLKETSSRFTDHAWVEPGNGMFLACTVDGPIHMVCAEELRVVASYKMPFGPDRPGGPHCLICFSQGFVVGGSDGLVAVWEKQDQVADGQPVEFRFGRAAAASRAGATICGADITQTEENLVLCFRTGDIGLVAAHALFNASASAGKSIADVQCNMIGGGYHAGPIASLDMAVHRPMAVSVGKKDGLIRVWNYVSRQCEICWEPTDKADPPLVAAVHPFGYFVAVSFAEKLRFYYVLAKGLKLHSEFSIRGVKLLRFSNGGHLLAAVQGKFVHMFSMRTVEKVVTLQGHSHGIAALCFDPEDNALWTCGTDGQLFEWDPQTGEKTSELASLRCEYLAASSGMGNQVFCSLASGSKCFLRRLQHCVHEQEQEIPGSVKLASLCQPAATGVLFAGSSSGALCVFPSCTMLSKFTENGLHSGPCTALCVAADGKTLLTAGEDGAIFVLGVSGLSSSGAGTEDAAAAAAAAATVERLAGPLGGGGDAARLPASEAVLIQRSQLQRRLEECRRLRDEGGELRAQLSAAAERLEAECEHKVAEARARDQAEIQELRRRATCIDMAHQAKILESERILKSMSSSHATAAEQLTNLYERKVEYEQERYEALKEDQVKLQALIENMRQQVKDQLQQEEEEAKMELERQLAEKDLEIQKHKDLLVFLRHRFDGLLEADGEAHDGEVVALAYESQKQIREQKEVEAKMRREQETLMKGLEMMEEDRMRVEKEQQEQNAIIRTLRDQAEELQRTLSSLKVERRERESTLGDKEQKIESYKDKVNTLKKFKHVLDKQLQEVTESLQPKEHMISQLTGHLKELEREFEQQLVEQRSMETDLKQKKHQVMLLASEAKELRDIITEKDRTITQYSFDIHQLVTQQTDVKLWPQEIRRLYHIYVCGELMGEERLPLEDLQRQMRQVERRVTSLAVRGGQMRAKCKTDIQRKAQENAQLVSDVNILRKERQILQTTIRALQRRLEELEAGGGLHAAAHPAALEDGPRRPGSAAATAPPPPPSSVSPPGIGPILRVPSGGQLPGVGHRATPPPLPARHQRTRSIPPLGAVAGGRHPQALKAKASVEDQKRLHALLATADLGRLAPAKTESQLLREKIDALLKEPSVESLRAGRRSPGFEEHIFTD